MAPTYRRVLECLLGLPMTDGNGVEVLRNGDQAFSAMLDAIAGADATVDLQNFGDWSGTIAEEISAALAARVGAGVRVRVLLDAFGSRRMNRSLLGGLVTAGVDVKWFRPLTNWRITQSTHRGHRRVLVCDNEVGFTGGIAIGDRWRGDARGPAEWRDTSLRLRGPGARGLWAAFVDNWAETGEPLFDEAIDPLPPLVDAGRSAVQVVRGDAETGWGEMATLVRGLIRVARRRIRISADYFVPDSGALGLLADAVQRGVSVQLLRPGRHVDSRASHLASEAQYPALFEAGVEVWGYQPSVFKVKAVTVDGEVAVVGGLNFNARSLTLDDEVIVVVLDPEVVAVLDSHLDDDLAHSERVQPSRWRYRSKGDRAAATALGMVARRL